MASVTAKCGHAPCAGWQRTKECRLKKPGPLSSKQQKLHRSKGAMSECAGYCSGIDNAKSLVEVKVNDDEGRDFWHTAIRGVAGASRGFALALSKFETDRDSTRRPSYYLIRGQSSLQLVGSTGTGPRPCSCMNSKSKRIRSNSRVSKHRHL